MKEENHRERRYRLWNCLKTLCEMEEQLETLGWSKFFRSEFRRLQALIDQENIPCCEEKDLQRLEGRTQELIQELARLLYAGSLQDRKFYGGNPG